MHIGIRCICTWEDRLGEPAQCRSLRQGRHPLVARTTPAPGRQPEGAQPNSALHKTTQSNHPQTSPARRSLLVERQQAASQRPSGERPSPHEGQQGIMQPDDTRDGNCTRGSRAHRSDWPTVQDRRNCRSYITNTTHTIALR